MLLNPKTNIHVKDFVERKLIIRLRIFFFVFFILLDIIVLEISLNYISVPLTLGALFIGMLSGLLFVRRKKIYWEEETSRVIARMDGLGIALLIIYILFAISRHLLLHRWLHGNAVTTCSLSFAAGGMASRVWSIRRQIRKVLKNKNII